MSEFMISQKAKFIDVLAACISFLVRHFPFHPVIYLFFFILGKDGQHVMEHINLMRFPLNIIQRYTLLAIIAKYDVPIKE